MRQRQQITAVKRFSLFLLIALVSTYSAGALDLEDPTTCLPEDCQVNPEESYEKCPIDCPKRMRPGMYSAFSHPDRDPEEEAYDFQIKDVYGKLINFEMFQDTVTLMMVVPTKKYASFYYKVLEHLHEVHPYVVDLVLIVRGDGEDAAYKPEQPPKYIKVFDRAAEQVAEKLGDMMHDLQYVPFMPTAFLFSSKNRIEMFQSPDLPILRDAIANDITELDLEL